MEPRHRIYHLLRDSVCHRDCHHKGVNAPSLPGSCASSREPLQDLPDVEGDRKYNIQTFATQLGVRNISLMVRPQQPPALFG